MCFFLLRVIKHGWKSHHCVKVCPYGRGHPCGHRQDPNDAWRRCPRPELGFLVDNLSISSTSTGFSRGGSLWGVVSGGKLWCWCRFSGLVISVAYGKFEG